MARNILFHNLPEARLVSLVGAFERISASAGEEIVVQGDSSIEDSVYLVAEGSCTVTVDGTIAPEPYGTIRRSDIFGESGVSSFGRTKSRKQ